MKILTIAVVALLLVANCAAQEATQNFTLWMLPREKFPKARCLDGSMGSYYFMPAPAESKHPNTWVFFFQGGGWCVNYTDCLERSKTMIGSSKHLHPTMGGLTTGIMGRVEERNPALFDANIVYLNYCDGYSFMSSREQPIEVNGTELYLRGSYIRKAVMEHVLQTTTLRNATELLISGCSAGGLAAYLHSSSMERWFRQELPFVGKIGAAPLSGFFLNAQNVAGEVSYGLQMQRWFATANASVDADAKCITSLPPSLHSMCIFAEVVYAQQTLPTFVFNSQLDAWQTSCILMGSFTSTDDNGMPHCNAYPKYASCVKSLEFSTTNVTCTKEEFAPMHSYQSVFLDRVASIPTFTSPKNGGFIISCVTHCENQIGAAYDAVVVNGVTAQQAFTAWWNDEKKDHLHLDCLMSTEAPFVCNPTC